MDHGCAGKGRDLAALFAHRDGDHSVAGGDPSALGELKWDILRPYAAALAGEFYTGPHGIDGLMGGGRGAVGDGGSGDGFVRLVRDKLRHGDLRDKRDAGG